VFTIPDTFNVLVPYNEAALYNALFKAASETLKTFARKELKGQLGMIAVLHTWGQTLWLHPHVHVVVTGGALSKDMKQWCSTGSDFLFDVYELSAAFRKRFCKIVGRAKLVFKGDAAIYADRPRFEAFLKEQGARDWVVYAKKPFAGPRQVLEYISRYTHRVAISNRRIIDIADDGTVSFTYRDYREADAAGLAPEKTMSLSATEFVGRFLRHVLPKGFRKIRMYGILAGGNRAAKIAAARELLGPAELPEDLDESGEPRESAALDPTCCPECGVGTMRAVSEIPRQRPPPVVMPWIKPATVKAA